MIASSCEALKFVVHRVLSGRRWTGDAGSTGLIRRKSRRGSGLRPQTARTPSSTCGQAATARNTHRNARSQSGCDEDLLEVRPGTVVEPSARGKLTRAPVADRHLRPFLIERQDLHDGVRPEEQSTDEDRDVTAQLGPRRIGKERHSARLTSEPQEVLAGSERIDEYVDDARRPRLDDEPMPVPDGDRSPCWRYCCISAVHVDPFVAGDEIGRAHV